MKKIISKLLGGVLLFSLSMSLTSCEGALDDILGEWSKPVANSNKTPSDPSSDKTVTKITVDLSGIDAKYKNDAGDQLKLALGDQVTLSFEILPAEAAGTEVTLTSGDPNIVSIEGLKVTAAGLGTTTVTAKAGDQTATLTVAIVAINLAAITPNVGTTEYNVSSDAILTGTLAENYKISIADGVSVTLKDVTINGTDNFSYQWAGITCAGDATIILEGENTVKGFCQGYPGIFIAEGKTLVIKGAGKLEASSNRDAAGIGGGWAINCGNIEIQGGIITANGGSNSAGIGTGYNATCGTITISNGSVTAKGGYTAAGIGSGSAGSEGTATCGDITISGGTVDATGDDSGAGIGCGGTGSDGTAICGNIIISSGTIEAKGGAAGIGSGSTFGGKSQCGNITISGGTVTATGGSYLGSAGIGSSLDNTTSGTSKGGSICGDILISGGTVTATGSSFYISGDKGAAAIGSGVLITTAIGKSKCGDITITAAVTLVTATKGSGATNSIGAGENGTCGTVTIGGNVGAKTASPYIYPTPAPTNAINGKFTINASGKQVYFAKGNLQAKTTDLGNNWSWGFATNQYDFIGDDVANNVIIGNGTVSDNGTVDLFGWSTAANYYGIHNSANASDYSGDFVDWGGNIGTGWRTLTKDEWNYLFSTRTSGSKVNGMSPSPDNARYTHATITDIGTGGIHGIILFPDGVTINYSDATYWGGINQYSSWSGSTKCTTSQWNALAAKGFVFLPAAGVRNGTTVSYPNNNGYYWSSYTASASSTSAHYTPVVASNEPTTGYDSRKIGISVRLVYPIE